jgi:hypothetical protein
MKHLKLFEDFNPGTQEVDEFLGLGHSDHSVKETYNKYVHSFAWAQTPFYLYLGDGNFVKLARASADDKDKAYEIIKKQGEADKWKGTIGIYGSPETGKNEFLLYKPDAAVRRGGGEAGLLSSGGTTEGDPKALAAVGDPILAEFKDFLAGKHEPAYKVAAE